MEQSHQMVRHVALICRWPSNCGNGRRWAEKERAELLAFETLLGKAIADAPLGQLREECAVHGVDIWTRLARRTTRGEM